MTTNTRRTFLRGAALAPAALAAPAIVKAQAPIRWRFQTYAGAALGEQVTKPIIDYINAAADGEMQVDLFYADQIVPTGELFQALQRGTIDGVHSDDDSMASPTPLRVFGGYFPFATKHILDVPVLFNQYGLADIWREEYAKVGVQWLSAAGQDPCNFNTTKEITEIQQIDLGHVIVDHELGFNVRNRRLAEMALIEPLHGEGPGTASITGFWLAGRSRLR